MFNVGEQVMYEDGRKAVIDRNVGGGDFIIRFSNGERLAVNQRTLRSVESPTAERPALLKAAVQPVPSPVIALTPKAEEKPPASPEPATKKRSRPKKVQ